MTAELFAVLGSFVGSAFALLKYVFASHRRTVDRFVTFLESGLARQEAANDSLRLAVSSLSESLREGNRVLLRIAERVGATA